MASAKPGSAKAFTASLAYGLNVKRPNPPKKPTAAVSKGASAIFGDDSDSDDPRDAAEAKGKPRSDRAGVNYMMLQEAAKNKADKRTQATWQAAVAEDATVFQYDEVYDQMEQTKTVEAMRRVEAKSKDKRPKYMAALMENAARKKLEDELRDERQAQREREREGEEFADKDVFVTGAYKKKLEELKKAAEEERRKEAEEARNDVTKRGDLSDLYRNMFKNKLVGGSAYKGDGAGPADANGATPAAADGDQGDKSLGSSGDQPPLSGGSPRGDRPRHEPSRTDMRADRHEARRADGSRRGRDDRRDDRGRDNHRGRDHHDRDRHHRDRDSGSGRADSRKRGQEYSDAPDSPPAAGPGKHARKTTEGDVNDAKARYLARKAAGGRRRLATYDA
mmetsp:Transcript_31327/g.94119  ORF Transcript_31327/g.94119 Transcript_31327/m.94119 type:complete len:392 (-) Transcript_31327:313-1488(-)